LTRQEIWEQLAAVRYGLVEVQLFEQWIYTAPELEGAVGHDHYLALVSFAFNQPHAGHELTRVIDRLYEDRRPSCLRRDAALWITRAFLGGRSDLATTARTLVGFRNSGENWVPDEFVYIDSELDEIPAAAEYPNWDEQALAAKLAELQPRLVEFERAAREVARDMLSKLEVEALAI
jgi:hypothetical protein